MGPMPMTTVSSRASAAPALGGIALVAVAAVAVRLVLFLGVPLYEDEAYYWLWSRHPAFGYFDHPPMVAWVIAASSPLVPGELGVRLGFLVCSGLVVVLTALIAREMSPAPAAPVIAAVLVASAPMHVLVGGLALPDSPTALAYAALCWLACRARGRRFILVGLAWGLALLGKYPAYFLVPGILVLVAWDRSFREELRTPWPWLGGLTALLVFLPNLWWNAHHGFITFTFGVHRAFDGHAGAVRLLEFAGLLVIGAGPVAALAGVPALVRGASTPVRRVAAATLAPLACFAISATLRGIEPNWLVFLYPPLCAAGGAALAALAPRRRTALLAAWVALVALATAVTARELRDPRWLSVTRPPLRRILAGPEVAAGVQQALGSRAEAFVIPSRYQLAAYLAFYGGWRRFGPSFARPSQLDLWDEKPAPGEPVVVVAFDHLPPDLEARLGVVGKTVDTVVDVDWRGRPLYRVAVARFAGQRAGGAGPTGQTREARPAQ